MHQINNHVDRKMGTRELTHFPGFVELPGKEDDHDDKDEDSDEDEQRRMMTQIMMMTMMTMMLPVWILSPMTYDSTS